MQDNKTNLIENLIKTAIYTFPTALEMEKRLLLNQTGRQINLPSKINNDMPLLNKYNNNLGCCLKKESAFNSPNFNNVKKSFYQQSVDQSNYYVTNNQNWNNPTKNIGRFQKGKKVALEKFSSEFLNEDICDAVVKLSDGVKYKKKMLSKKCENNLNHLINFHFDENNNHRTRVRNSNLVDSGFKFSNFSKANYYKKSGSSSIFSKERFLQANSQLVMITEGDYKIHIVNPDALVDWKIILEVKQFVYEIPSCPICLYAPKAGRITKCGHIYCWPCIIHYLFLDEDFEQKSLKGNVQTRFHRIKNNSSINQTNLSLNENNFNIREDKTYLDKDMNRNFQNLSLDIKVNDTVLKKNSFTVDSDKFSFIEKERVEWLGSYLEQEISRKCPICSSLICQSELKGVQVVKVKKYTVGQEISLTLMRKERGKLTLIPKQVWLDNKIDDVEMTRYDENFDRKLINRKIKRNNHDITNKVLKSVKDNCNFYDKLILADDDYVLRMFETDRIELMQMLAEEQDNTWESSFIQAALISLETNQTNWIMSRSIDNSNSCVPILNRNIEKNTAINKHVNLPENENKMENMKIVKFYSDAFNEEEKEEKKSTGLDDSLKNNLKNHSLRLESFSLDENAVISNCSMKSLKLKESPRISLNKFTDQLEAECLDEEIFEIETGISYSELDKSMIENKAIEIKADKYRIEENNCLEADSVEFGDKDLYLEREEYKFEEIKDGEKIVKIKRKSIEEVKNVFIDKDAYYFYQASDGQNIFMHPLNVSCLTRQYISLANSPSTITAIIVEIEEQIMDEDIRRRRPYLSHLPLLSQYALVELQLKPPIVCNEILQGDLGEAIGRRKQEREYKEKEYKRQASRIDREQNRKMGIDPNVKIVRSDYKKTNKFHQMKIYGSNLLDNHINDKNNFPMNISNDQISITKLESYLNSDDQHDKTLFALEDNFNLQVSSHSQFNKMNRNKVYKNVEHKDEVGKNISFDRKNEDGKNMSFDRKNEDGKNMSFDRKNEDCKNISFAEMLKLGKGKSQNQLSSNSASQTFEQTTKMSIVSRENYDDDEQRSYIPHFKDSFSDGLILDYSEGGPEIVLSTNKKANKKVGKKSKVTKLLFSTASQIRNK